MHKICYASGFLYNLSSQQILLQQPNTAASAWVLFEKEYTENEQPEVIFKDTIRNLLDFEIDATIPIYSYTNETTKNDRSLFYTTIKDLQEFLPKNNYIFRWFSFKEVIKIQAAEQTKHDIIVGQRVIEAASRKDRGEHTLQ